MTGAPATEQTTMTTTTTARKAPAKKAPAKKAPATKAATTATTKTATTRTTPARKASRKKSDHAITDYFSGLVDTTKDILDDLLETAGDVEVKARKRTKKAAKAVVPSRKDIDGVRDQVKDLGKQTRKLAKLSK